MEEDGRSARGKAAIAAAKKNKEKEKNDANTLWKQPRHPVPFAQIPGITDVLLERLEALGAARPPSFMIGKSLKKSDVSSNQARMFFSCKRESRPEFTGVFTETEMRLVKDTLGLLVTAFDRDGRRYDLTFKYLESNSGYRFISGWRAYAEDNGLGVDMLVELWWFRSRKLLNRYEQRERPRRKKEKVPIMVDSGHPDGSLGLVLLHYGNDDLLEPEQAAAEEPDEAPPVKETAGNDQEPEQAADDESDEAPPVQETETEHMEPKKMTTTAEDKLADDGGTCAEPIIKSKTTIAEDKLADGGGECAERRISERNTVITDDDVEDAAIGLIELRWRCGGGGGGGGQQRRQ